MQIINMIHVEDRNYVVSERVMELVMCLKKVTGPSDFLKAAALASSLRVVRFDGPPPPYATAIAIEWAGRTLGWLPSTGIATISECTSLEIAQAMYDKAVTVAGKEASVQ